MLTELLNYDKIECGTLTLERTVWVASDLIRRTTAEFNLSAAAKSIEYRVDCRIENEREECVAVADMVKIGELLEVPDKLIKDQKGDMVI